MIKHSFKQLEYRFKVIRAQITSDKNYRKNKFKKLFGTELDLNPPNTLNEKINYRMIFQRNNFFTIVADKVAVRDYIELVLGKEYLIPVLSLHDNINMKDFDDLPQQFVMKCNHDSGSAIICYDKTKLNKDEVIRHFRRHLKKNPYYTNREWQYKNIKPKIIVEQLIDVFEGRSKDITPEMFRIHCFHGVPHYIEVDFTTTTGKEYSNIYNSEWQLQPFTLEFSNTPYIIQQPATFNKMLELARKIAVDFDYCRLDLMSGQEKIYFSEITLTPESGQLQFHPKEWDERLGKLWRLG
ncbi:ATP-grasp fold amidoligase family protein [Morganella morganii]|uniref:ATP-grasp fold amidoligase family protein n=1 Tax=Morganella morganii TaxID=582 RepID=UPI00128C74CB|nr:ATP-grasp fold amidoligase family protein [Morganella morganii]MQC09041.1 glycosyltransferase [Morganella morganii]MQC11719.1 glycosyltransferase [Morganella morganii]MQC16378.1 glycosyltransferase [Morganella morganii]